MVLRIIKCMFDRLYLLYTEDLNFYLEQCVFGFQIRLLHYLEVDGAMEGVVWLNTK